MFRFAKYHGLGNDFIIVDQAETRIEPSQVPQLCERHRGIGGDGVLVASQSAECWRMVVYNADGSRPQMCGNGLRCLARWLVDTGRAESPLWVDTDAGRRVCVVGEDGWVEIEMGVASLLAESLPMLGENPRLFISPNGPVMVYGVSVGNPHAVMFVDALPSQKKAEELGQWLCEHPAFPEQTNVEFVAWREDGAASVVVYERGCGLTQACGTGAVAVAALLVEQGMASGQQIAVDLPGGRLWIRFERDVAGVRQWWLRGEAVAVFCGEGFA